jgi:hypothetical protein
LSAPRFSLLNEYKSVAFLFARRRTKAENAQNNSRAFREPTDRDVSFFAPFDFAVSILLDAEARLALNLA